MIGSGVRDSCGNSSAWGNVQFVQAKRTVGKIDLHRILSAAEASILGCLFFDIKFYLGLEVFFMISRFLIIAVFNSSTGELFSSASLSCIDCFCISDSIVRP
ncbi:hypothetical protein ACIP97_04030 [Peribacillus frigoritolerans]|uniref:hypothetical protein n=1 Tax=Peribacillus frigoritolerans TaxID=450367 RepID=UPI0038097B69